MSGKAGIESHGKLQAHTTGLFLLSPLLPHCPLQILLTHVQKACPRLQGTPGALVYVSVLLAIGFTCLCPDSSHTVSKGRRAVFPLLAPEPLREPGVQGDSVSIC